MSFRSIAVASACLVISWGCQQNAAPPPVPVAPAASPGAATGSAPAAFSVEEGFQRLMLADFTSFPADGETWRESGSDLICSGSPKGYLYSSANYGNFTLRCDYRFVPPPGLSDPVELDKCNTGFMIHIQEPHKVWPASLEVQGKHVEMCSIKSNGGVPAVTIQDDPSARETARKPVGAWNSVEIVSRDGGLTAVLNGVTICTSEPGELTSGLIGLQSEAFEVHFRNLRIRAE